jgi:hypothetical protein
MIELTFDHQFRLGARDVAGVSRGPEEEPDIPRHYGWPTRVIGGGCHVC